MLTKKAKCTCAVFPDNEKAKNLINFSIDKAEKNGTYPLLFRNGGSNMNVVNKNSGSQPGWHEKALGMRPISESYYYLLLNGN